MWWLALEAVIARNDHIGLQVAGRNRTFDCETVAAKRALYDEIYWWLRSLPTEAELRGVVQNLAACYHVDIAAFCKELCMGWPELAELAADPLVTIGAHTVNHPMLAKLPQKAVRSEMDLSRSVIEAALGIRPQHLSYPVGDRTSAGPREFEIAAELGFKTAVTTRPGVLFAEHSQAPHRIAADFTQRRISALALCARFAVRLGDSDVERFPPPGCGLGHDPKPPRT